MKARITLCLICLICSPCWAEKPVFDIEIKNHLFHPSEIKIPAGTKVKLIIYNRDSTPEEFESYALNREKVIMGGRKATIFIGPLSAGTYPFFGEFNPRTAQGKVIVNEI
ncbi:MAG: cupredoxin domain-containing protein [Spongiibacteraceae bacterium]